MSRSQSDTGLSTLPGVVAAPGHGTGRFPSARDRPHHFVWFTPALGLLLGGYLFFSKSFAYLHIPGTPLFVGEIVLGIGIVEVLQVRSPWRHLLATAPVLKVLAAFMAVCTVRLVRDLPVYQLDAIRDSSIWYYGIFAFLVAAAAVREPTFVPRLLRWYRQVLPWYFMWAPIAIALAGVDGLAAISVPGTDTPINAFRFNDIAVHLGLGLGFLWLGVDRLVAEGQSRTRDVWLSVMGVLALLVAASQSRGGFVAAGGTLVIVFAYLPSGRRRQLVFSVTAGLPPVLTVVWALDLRLQGERRDVSLEQITANLVSLTGNEESDELSGTVQWREGFWAAGPRRPARLRGVADRARVRPDPTRAIPGRRRADQLRHQRAAAPQRPQLPPHHPRPRRVPRVRAVAPALADLRGAAVPLGPAATRGSARPHRRPRVWYLAAVAGFLIGAYFDPSLVVAAMLLLSRLDFPFLAARGYVDVPYLALILWAAALEAEKPRRGGIVWVLLTLAGLLRPEVWLLAGIYGLWLVAGKPLREWVRVGAIIAIAPVLWALSDFIVTGDPMYSLNYTTESSRQLGRRQSLSELPGVTARYLFELTKPPVLIAGVAGIVLAWRMARERIRVPAVLLVWGVGTFLLVSLRGFSVINRYVIVGALALMLFAAFAIAGFSRLPRGHRAIAPWAIGSGILVLGGLVYTLSIFNPAYVNRELKLRDTVRQDLEAVLASPRVKAAAACGPISVPNHKLLADVRWIADRDVDGVVARTDPKQTARQRAGGVGLYLHSGTVFLKHPAYGPFDQTEDSPLIQVPPPGFERVRVGRYFSAYVRCG